jgi:serine/threonine protein phosphatase 1
MDVNFIAVGDIHGLSRTLERLLGRIPSTGQLIFLGDYIDRGPSSREVINRLLRLEQERDCVFLRGNHEAMALEALAGNLDAEVAWQRNGGLQTLRSYDYTISDEHLDFLRRTRPYFATDQYIFVHGGLLPGCQPEAMPEDMLWWVREPFLSSDDNWGRLVIHGHTPTASGRPEVRPNRINIDSGAVYGGKLTALILPKRKFITESANEQK